MLRARIVELQSRAKKWTAVIGGATAVLSLILVGVQNVIYRQEIALLNEITSLKLSNSDMETECRLLRSAVKATNDKFNYHDKRIKRLENGGNSN